MVEHVVPQLGRLVPVDIRSVWTSEPYSFDPWLTQPENLQFLADALDLPGLEIVHTQAPIGPFYADIVARVIGTDHYVMIENQLDKADHRHLGQVLTYAPQFDARICVWIAAHICEEHRAAVDWLNRITGEGYAFFGVEVRAVKIGDSAPAPLFDVVARPNQWARVTTATSASGDALGEQGSENEDYWSQFHAQLKALELPTRQATKPLRSETYWIPVEFGSTAYLWAFRSQGRKPHVNAGISFYSSGGRAMWELLRQRSSEIDEAIGTSLKWIENDKGTAFHIQFEGLPASQGRDQWAAEQAELLRRVDKLNAVILPMTRPADLAGTPTPDVS